ncbi:hypothetical protein HJC23_007928 [Cyclotella cryptica]|uniref:Uncharacterized protein n=1 Tax=Cyclotella cryptica TaxID=29204 RepID=A0ABD3NYY9_9STRA
MKFLISPTAIAIISIERRLARHSPPPSQMPCDLNLARRSKISCQEYFAIIHGWAAPKSAMIGGAGVNQYLSNSGGDGLNVSGLGFVYGIPITLAGAALKYAEIDPVPCITAPGAEAVFDAKATEIIQKIKQDVTRHRYGDEAHLDTTVKKLGLVVPGKAYPQLMELREDVTDDGELAFTMVWQSLETPYKMWADEKRRKRDTKHFLALELELR